MADIELRNLSKHFGSLAAVDDIDLDVEAGEVVCLLGPSGCGKTTTLRMIAGPRGRDGRATSSSPARGSTTSRRAIGTSPWCSSSTRSTRA